MMHLLILGLMLLDPAPQKLSRPEGVKIVYDVRGSGDTTLVFIHGWASERGVWRHQADYFAARNRVVTIDLAAHGQSTAGKRKVWTLAVLADDVRAVVEKLKARQVILVGHSMGAPVALLAAAKLPMVTAVILVDAVHNADRGMSREAAAGMASRFTKDFPGAMKETVRSMFPPGSPLADEVIGKALQDNPAILTALIGDYPNLDQPAMLRALKIPIRAINSSATATNLAVNRKYANFDATVLQGSGHYLMLEKPGEFNAILREWLSVLK